jgi:hypothetical protein
MADETLEDLDELERRIRELPKDGIWDEVRNGTIFALVAEVRRLRAPTLGRVVDDQRIRSLAARAEAAEEEVRRLRTARAEERPVACRGCNWPTCGCQPLEDGEAKGLLEVVAEYEARLTRSIEEAAKEDPRAGRRLAEIRGPARLFCAATIGPQRCNLRPGHPGLHTSADGTQWGDPFAEES